MSQPENNIVHETEAQRRHARVKLPARIVMKDKNGISHELSLRDLSASGFGLQTGDFPFEQGGRYTGELLFHLNTIEFRLPITFIVVHYVEDEQLVGCEFDELNPEQVSILRLFISKYLAGDLVTSSDILTTLSRDNFTKARKHAGSGELTGWKRIRALFGTALAACISVAVLTFIAYNLYQNFFVTRAVTALVDIETEVVQAPAEGYLELVANEDVKVKQGAVLGTISSPASEFLQQNKIAEAASKEVASLLAQVSNSLVKSPCDGMVLQKRVKDKTYVRRGEALFDLVCSGSRPYIKAVFNYKNADDLAVGTRVKLRYPAEDTSFSGTIRTASIDLQSSMSSVTVTIEPEIIPGLDRVKGPVFVMTRNTPSFFHIFKR